MSTQRKPSIVFVHGLWADGSCFSKLIPPAEHVLKIVYLAIDKHVADTDNA